VGNDPQRWGKEGWRMLAQERMAVRDVARYWWVFLVSGILWLIIAWVVLRMDQTSVAAVGVLLGVVFLFAGINEVGAAEITRDGWRVWHWITVDTFFALASVLGLILILYGSFEIFLAISSHGVNPYWWLNLIVGILLILLAFWVSGSDRVYALAQRAYLILFWVGFFALFKGFSQIFLAFNMRHAGKEAAAGLPA
jgi:uncharacterized membrane protein HdeD (DUF308 family)